MPVVSSRLLQSKLEIEMNYVASYQIVSKGKETFI